MISSRSTTKMATTAVLVPLNPPLPLGLVPIVAHLCHADRVPKGVHYCLYDATCIMGRSAWTFGLMPGGLIMIFIITFLVSIWIHRS